MKTLIISIISILLFSSCQKQLEIEIPQNMPKLVINSLFTTDSIFKINISSSTYYYYSEYNIIDDAIALLFENNVLIDTFSYIGNGDYIIKNFYPSLHKQYKLQVEKEGFITVFAEDSIPDKVIPFYYYKTDNVLADDDGYFFSNFVIIFNDIINNSFYKLNLSTNFDQDHFYNTILKSNNIIIQSEIGSNFTTHGVFFSDNLFLNEVFKLDVLYSTHNYEPFDSSYTLRLIFQSISENYYKYCKSEYKYLYKTEIDELYFIPSDPVQLYTNVENGFGIFAGYNCYVDSI